MSARLLLSTLSLYLITLNTYAKLDNKTAAVVNGMKITKDEFEKALHQNKIFLQNAPVDRNKVLRDLVNRKLGIEKAKKEKLIKNQIVKDKVEDVLFHAQVSKDLEGPLNQIKVSDKEVKEYYKTFPEYRTAHILFRMTANPSKEEEKAARETALKVYNELQNKPNKFAELANKYSQSSAAPNGGDMGYQPAVRLAYEYFQAIKNKKPGYISPLVRTPLGYHIIKVLDVKPVEKINMELYKKIVYDRKRDRILATYFDKLRKQAKIEVNKELLN